MGYVKYLECSGCGKKYEQIPQSVCSACFAPLDVIYDYEQISQDLTKEKIAEREPALWRYRELLPLDRYDNIISLEDGFTPLRRAGRLEETLGVKELYLKDDTVNPTYSFKDRPASVSISKAREFRFDSVGCASTGNLASAVAAHAAKVGYDCYIFIPANLEISKIAQALIYGATILAFRGTYDDANRIANLVADKLNCAIVNVNLRSYYVEGSKTLAYEIAEQLCWEIPDRIIIPMASGALLCAIHKGFQELEKIGFIPTSKIILSGSQPFGCAPIVEAFRSGEEIVPVNNPETIVKSLAIGNPASGYEALEIMRETGGSAWAVTDRETLEAVRLLASNEGVYAEPAAATTIAALKRGIDEGEIGRDERIVCLITVTG